MQDSDQSHRAIAMQQNTADYIAADEWISYSPDVNPSDYCTWDILQDLVCENRRLPFANLQDLTSRVNQKQMEGSKIHCTMEKELISRLDSRTLPLEPRHRCTRSVLSTCLRNDVIASSMLTKHTPDDVIVTHALLYDLSIGPIFNDLERLDFKVTPRR